MPGTNVRGLVTAITLLLVMGLLCGCGGGGNGGEPDGEIFIPYDPPSTSELPAKEGLIVGLKTEKLVYKQGEPIRFWFSVENQGSQTHTLELRPPTYDMSARTTYLGCAYYLGMDGWRYDPAYQIMPDDRAKCEVAPGAEARLVELVWDQKTMQGPMAQIGFYDIGLVLFNLYLDGHSLVDPPLASEVSSGKAVKVVE